MEAAPDCRIAAATAANVQHAEGLLNRLADRTASRSLPATGRGMLAHINHPVIPMTSTAANLPAFYDDLDSTLAEAIACLAAGVRDRRDPFHTPTLASIGLDGAPKVRTVVLRGWDADTRTVRVHTDRRTPKVAELRANPATAVHMYDARRKLQLRLGGTVSLHADDAPAAKAWAATRAMSRLCYQVTRTPGSRVSDPADVASDADATGQGVDHFLVLNIVVSQIEWLYLAHAGHRRAAFGWDGDAGRWAGHWLVP